MWEYVIRVLHCTGSESCACEMYRTTRFPGACKRLPNARWFLVGASVEIESHSKCKIREYTYRFIFQLTKCTLLSREPTPMHRLGESEKTTTQALTPMSHMKASLLPQSPIIQLSFESKWLCWQMVSESNEQRRIDVPESVENTIDFRLQSRPSMLLPIIAATLTLSWCCVSANHSA